MWDVKIAEVKAMYSARDQTRRLGGIFVSAAYTDTTCKTKRKGKKRKNWTVIVDTSVTWLLVGRFILFPGSSKWRVPVTVALDHSGSKRETCRLSGIIFERVTFNEVFLFGYAKSIYKGCFKWNLSLARELNKVYLAPLNVYHHSIILIVSPSIN